MKHVCREWGSQGILGGKVDEPPKTSLGCSSQRARYERHAERNRVGVLANELDRHGKVPGLAANPGI